MTFVISYDATQMYTMGILKAFVSKLLTQKYQTFFMNIPPMARLCKIVEKSRQCHSAPVPFRTTVKLNVREVRAKSSRCR
jgi:hypothetical protein